MENFPRKRKSKISLSLFATLSDSFSLDKSAKSPRSFPCGDSDVVGLGIVAAMTDPFAAASARSNLSPSPKSCPIPIVVSASAKAAANFRGAINLDLERNDDDEVDKSSESYTCVISHHADNSIRKRVYFDGKLNGVEDYDCDGSAQAEISAAGVFSASPAYIGELEREFWTSDFLNSCFLCKKLLHGLDIFMYRGEKAFCSWDCRDKHMRGENHKDKCSSEAMKTPLDYSSSPCSSPQVFLAGVAAA